MTANKASKLTLFAVILVIVVRAGGLEPPRHKGPQILSLLCLPFHHARTDTIPFLYSKLAPASTLDIFTFGSKWGTFCN